MHYCLSIPTPEPLPSPIHGRVPTRGAGPRGAREAAAAPEPQPHPHGVHPLPHGVGPPPRRLLELANDLRQPSRRRVKVAWRARLGAGRGDTSRASRARVAGQVSKVEDDAPRVASLAQLPLPPRQLLRLSGAGLVKRRRPHAQAGPGGGPRWRGCSQASGSRRGRRTAAAQSSGRPAAGRGRRARRAPRRAATERGLEPGGVKESRVVESRGAGRLCRRSVVSLSALWGGAGGHSRLGRDKGQLRRDGRHRRHVARRLLAGDPRAQPAEEEGEAAQRGAVVGREEGRLGAHVDGDDGRRA